MELLRTEVDDVDGWTVLRPVGQIDLATAPDFRQTLMEAGFSSGHRVIVDLDGVEFLDSIGLGVLIGGHKRAVGHDGDFAIAVQSDRIVHLLELTGLNQVFRIARTVDELLSASAET